MHRRDLLNSALSTSALTILGSGESEAGELRPGLNRITDTNVSLFHWPYRRLPLDEPERLVKKLRELGITQAWAGSFEGLLHRDISAVNHRLVEVCGKFPELKAVGEINPTLPGWEQELERCAQRYRMHAVRIHPNYHGYQLADERFRRLLQIVASRGLLLQCAIAMEDTRTQHESLQVPDVDWQPLLKILGTVPKARIQILNARLRGPQLEAMEKCPGVFYDTARIESTDGVATMLSSVARGRVLFGSHAPFLILEAALIRVGESQLPDPDLQQIMHQNAEALVT